MYNQPSNLNNFYPQTQPTQQYGFQQPYQTQSVTNQFGSRGVSMIQGRMVANPEEIMPSEVPMDGSVSFFPQSDCSCVYAKVWNADGTIKTFKFVPEIKMESNSQDPTSFIIEKLNSIEERLDSMNKRNNHRYNNKKNFNKNNQSTSKNEEDQ